MSFTRCLVCFTPCVILSAVACTGGSVTGELDGVTVPSLASAIVAKTPPLNGAAGEQLHLEGYTFGDACALRAEELAIDDNDELVAFHEARMPSDYWEVSVNFIVEDLAALAGTTVPLEGAAGADVLVKHVRQHPVVDNSGILQVDQVRMAAVGGALEVTALNESGAAVAGDVELELLPDGPGGPEGDAGTITLSLNGGTCEPYRAALVDAFELE